MKRSHSDTACLFAAGLSTCLLVLVIILALGWTAHAGVPVPVPNPRAHVPTPAKQCKPLAEGEARFKTHARAISAEMLEQARDFYNSFPPEGKEKWSQAWLLQAPDGSGFLLVGNDGKVCGDIHVPPKDWPKFVAVLEGTPV